MGVNFSCNPTYLYSPHGHGQCSSGTLGRACPSGQLVCAAAVRKPHECEACCKFSLLMNENK